MVLLIYLLCEVPACGTDALIRVAFKFLFANVLVGPPAFNTEGLEVDFGFIPTC